jgi:hypothetical protein
VASVSDLSLLGTRVKKKGILRATTKQDSPSTDSDMENSGVCGDTVVVEAIRLQSSTPEYISLT